MIQPIRFLPELKKNTGQDGETNSQARQKFYNTRKNNAKFASGKEKEFQTKGTKLSVTSAKGINSLNCKIFKGDIVYYIKKRTGMCQIPVILTF